MAEAQRSRLVLLVTCVFTSISFAFVVTRVISRWKLLRRLGPDDWIISAAWILAFGMTITISYATQYGLGMREAQILPVEENSLRRLIYAADVLYNPALLATKASILIQYFRLFSSMDVVRYFNIACLIAVAIGGVALTLVNAFQCRPPDEVFRTLQSTEKDSKCTDILTIYLASAPFNIITDVAILLLPMAVFKRLCVPRKAKFILVVTFGFGLFVTAIDIIRVAYLQRATSKELTRAIHPHASLEATDSNFYWDAALSFMWSAIEVHIGIMCACVPALKPLVTMLMPWLMRSPSEPAHGTFDSSNLYRTNNARQRLPSRPEDHTDRLYPELRETEEVCSQSQPPRPRSIPLAVRGATSAGPTAITVDSSPRRFDHTSEKALEQITSREGMFPLMVITSLFFIWGLEYGWLDILNQGFQKAAGMTAGQNSALHSAYYIGYLVGPIGSGYFTLRSWGYRLTAVVGLGIYACGTLIFWPAAVLTSFPACFITNFIVGFGLSNLEVSANPYIVMCGAARYSAFRLCLSQGVQAVGSLVASLIAQSTFGKSSDTDISFLVESQWTYLGMSFFTVGAGITLFLLRLPESNVEEFQADTVIQPRERPWDMIQLVVLVGGVVSQFCYVGAQETNSTTFDAFFAYIAPSCNSNMYMTVARAVFAASRFIAAGLALFILPRMLLLGFSIGALVFQALAAHQQASSRVSATMLLLAYFMEGPIFPLIFTLTLQQNRHRTKAASVALTSAISGGAVFSPIALAIQRSSETGVHGALFVAVALFAMGVLFPGILNFAPSVRLRCDGALARTRQNLEILPAGEIGTLELQHLHKQPSLKIGSGIRRDIELVVEREMVVERVEDLSPTSQ